MAAATLLLSALALPARAQPAPITIRGRVIADESGDANARVAIVSNAVGAPVVLTDGDSQFALTAPAGALRLVASKTGYGRREVTRPAAEQRVEIRLQRGAAVSGRIVDEFGDPMQGARVVAQSAADPSNVAWINTTDDLGEYRLPSLPAGAYVIAVTTAGALSPRPMANNLVIYAPVNRTMYYPGVATAAEAQPVHLHAGEERPRIDFVIPAEQTAAQPFSLEPHGPLMSIPVVAIPRDAHSTGIVRGRIASTDGRGLPHAHVKRVVTANPLQSIIGRTDGDAQFEFRDLPAARFSVVASKTGYSLAAPVPVFDLAAGEARDRVEVTLARWGTLAGRVVDELGEPIQGARVQVLHVRYEAGRRRLLPAGNAVRLTDDLGRYRLHSLPQGRYIVSASVGDVGSAEVPGYTRAFFPGTPNASDAQFVSVGAFAGRHWNRFLALARSNSARRRKTDQRGRRAGHGWQSDPHAESTFDIGGRRADRRAHPTGRTV